jgi:hypothetical protein
MEERILTAQDAARSLGYTDSSSREWIISHAHMLFNSKHVRFDCTGDTMKRYSVHAKIDFGRWLADCPICSRSNYVDPADPVFYCFGCGNQGSGNFVPVVFPEDINKITALVLARPMIFDETDENPISRAINARPFFPGLVRNWDVEQSIDDLVRANEIMEKSNG